MKKSKNSKKNKISLKEQLMLIFRGAQHKFAGHGVFIVFVIAGVAIGFSLLRSRAYLNPVRNEAHYQEVTSSTNYSTIDLKLVTKLEDALNDTDVTVGPSLVPDRVNPFSE